MVNVSRTRTLLLVLIIFTLATSTFRVAEVQAAIVYDVDKIWCRVDIFKDGIISVFYNITVHVDASSQEELGGLYVEMPMGTITSFVATDPEGHNLTVLERGNIYEKGVLFYTPSWTPRIEDHVRHS
ncbi:MAG TPA: hypothetical protein VJ574_02800 [Candidatus Bathyarchaeia archaeon]|nr:hypothetical protein [Candidatus Bathyarchaeia archaeon]